jgi:hypothetical protein
MSNFEEIANFEHEPNRVCADLLVAVDAKFIDAFQFLRNVDDAYLDDYVKIALDAVKSEYLYCIVLSPEGRANSGKELYLMATAINPEQSLRTCANKLFIEGVTNYSNDIFYMAQTTDSGEHCFFKVDDKKVSPWVPYSEKVCLDELAHRDSLENYWNCHQNDTDQKEKERRQLIQLDMDFAKQMCAQIDSWQLTTHKAGGSK